MGPCKSIQMNKRGDITMNLEELAATILIADDDIPTTKLFSLYLKNSGFSGEIIPAYNGIEAVEKCWLYYPELVFIDINMPFKDGISAIEELRAGGFTHAIVVITSYSEFEKQCLAAGADVVLSKPVSRDEFLKQVKKFLQRSYRIPDESLPAKEPVERLFYTSSILWGN